MTAGGRTVVYAAGVWDMFHIGHLNLLRAAKGLGDILIAGIKTDELVAAEKGHRPLMAFSDRRAIVESCRYVDLVVRQETLEKDALLEALNVDILVAGSDKAASKIPGHDYMIAQGRDVFYLPYTMSMTSTKLSQALAEFYLSTRASETSDERPGG